ncbi:GNAT family N-acetyltransferase [Hymenobacter weizhouensis]|uniref:GNAT family N-acetyltransferase n=1 Tax=Hymenobacter sp. YIM 151500-1 TaxID=2987689 RepID=UPI002227692E|nr:GNAT family N-acetyltransferase [Hymenobacter sp. YIM 151500-1]UYZ62283.1 GNAT family N-acetyltransferase [Hymenobacter sp. YIM 151500-1]
MPAARILDYQPSHQPAFRALNQAWITQYFEMEKPDYDMLDQPERHILEPGGAILMAEYEGELVGTCALIREEEGVFELAKMAVAPAAQGLGIGWALGQAALAKARQLGARQVELLSNSRLKPALALYRKLGFRAVPVPPGPYQRADVKMVLDL